MLRYLTLLQIFFFLLIFFQDLKERKVYVIFFLLAHINAVFLFALSPNFLKEELFFNYALIAILIGSVTLYAKLRHISLKNSLGLGDVLFFTIMATGLKTTDFIQNLAFSLIFSLLLHLILKKVIRSNYNLMVPLAGFQALYCSFFYVYALL